MTEPAEYTYQLLYKRDAKPHMDGDDLYNDIETNGIPPGGVRWMFETRYCNSKPSYWNVLLQSILEMCKKHNVTPLEIRHPPHQGGRAYVDVIFARSEDVHKIYDDDISFDFYGTQPELVDRAAAVREQVGLCIQTLPSDTNLQDVLVALRANTRIRQAGQIVDVWSLHSADTGRFKGKVLVLLELQKLNGVVPLPVRAAIPGRFVFNAKAYLVRFADRPAWCFQCRYDEDGAFHSIYTCPVTPCDSCKRKGHSTIQCPKRQAQLARKSKNEQNDSSDDDDDDLTPPAASAGDRASMERRFAELGIRDGSEEAEELARDFGVLALSESDIGH